MPTITKYRVISESEGWITEYESRVKAEQRATDLNRERGVPEDHYVKEVEEVF